jgi:hypothetical protein
MSVVIQSASGPSLPQRKTNLRWSRVAPDSFDLKLENPEELNTQRFTDLIERLDHESHRNQHLREKARKDLRLWLEDPRGPLKSHAYALVSNWFLTDSPGDRNSTIARHCQDLWDKLFAYRPELWRSREVTQ